MNLIKKSILFGIALLFSSFSAIAEIKVVTTIKPIHSLVSGVMDGVSNPTLIIEGSNSPHNFSLKPSHAKILEEADIVFWIGEDLESFMEKPLNSLAKNAVQISFMDLKSIKKLKFREMNDHDDHDDHHGHEDEHEGHDDHDDDGHKDDDHDDHGHDDHHGHEDEDDDSSHDGHNHGEFDAHIWLDPENAKVMISEIAHELSELDPQNKSNYEKNAEKMISSLDDLIDRVSIIVQNNPSFIVFHDAYQYFENRFNIKAAGALTLNPEVLPGAKQIAEIQELIEHDNVKCIFSEPQYNPKIIEMLSADMNVSTSVLDPLGANIEVGPKMYNELILEIANSLSRCD
ncbi:periplasmic solute-binding family protein [alpha proteobacterium HIMB59]|nr:periplasmic solute-binding family protein [alpha proteobacterium HIMB59]